MSAAVTIHPFKAWLRNNRLSQEWAAVELKLSRLSLHRYFSGLRPIPLDVKLQIENLTEGAVTAEGMCSFEVALARKEAA